MRLLLRFSGFDDYEDQIVVTYEGDLKDFPPYGKYDNRYWGALMYDEDDTGIADYVMCLGEHMQSALPFNVYGVPFPITDLEDMFNLRQLPIGSCDCGAKFTSFPNSHMFMCRQWRKT